MQSKNTTWFFVADRSRAVIYETTSDGLKRIHDFDEPAVRAHATELMTGKRGRRSDFGQARSAMDRQTSVQQTEVDRFVHAIGEWLHLQADDNAFDGLVLVAGPQMLGEMRNVLTAPVSEKLVGTLDKVYTQLPQLELERHLEAAFPAQMVEKIDRVPTSARRGQEQPAS